MRGGEGDAALHRCQEQRMFRLLKMIQHMLGRAGLNVTTNGILLDSFHRCFEGSVVENLTYFLYFFFNKTVLIVLILLSLSRSKPESCDGLRDVNAGKVEKQKLKSNSAKV